ncbi:hypothetical protein L1987_42990 [Smallanthus sonchifolius]|uniref:Uncharacterized protein n=1 Tax=Smallanthus sonchifolius TaxID=185202 RepID=A0ACB9GLB8_9ASTR|nr:hypothetical protein L1987_42990 [Smallanthus sonchifolius]
MGTPIKGVAIGGFVFLATPSITSALNGCVRDGWIFRGVRGDVCGPFDNLLTLMVYGQLRQESDLNVATDGHRWGIRGKDRIRDGDS